MWRRKDIQGGIVASLIMLAVTCHADVWPSWLSPASGGFDRGNQAVSSGVERLTVVAGPWAWTNYAVTNIYADHFSQFAKCEAAKAMYGAAIDYGVWVYPTNSYTPETLQYVTRSNVLARYGIPTNWFHVTPRNGLSMATNGWMYIPAVASNVVWMVSPVEWYPKTFSNRSGMAEYDLRPNVPQYPGSRSTYSYPYTNTTIYRQCLNARAFTDLVPYTLNPNLWGQYNPYADWSTAKRIVDYTFLYHFSDLGDVEAITPHVPDWPTNGPFGQEHYFFDRSPYAIAASPKVQVHGGCYGEYYMVTNFTYGPEYTVNPYGTWVENGESNMSLTAIMQNTDTISEIVTNDRWVVLGYNYTNMATIFTRFDGCVDYLVYEARTNYHDTIATNYVQEQSGNFITNWSMDGYWVAVTNYEIIATNEITEHVDEWKYKATKAQISSYPYTGNITNNPFSTQTTLWTNTPHAVDFWGQFELPFVPYMNRTNDDGAAFWGEYNYTSYLYTILMSWIRFGSTNLSYSLYADCVNVPSTPGWAMIGSTATVSTPIVWGPYVGISNDLSYIINSNLWCGEPGNGEIVADGWDCRTNQAVTKWMFDWFR